LLVEEGCPIAEIVARVEAIEVSISLLEQRSRSMSRSSRLPCRGRGSLPRCPAAISRDDLGDARPRRRVRRPIAKGRRAAVPDIFEVPAGVGQRMADAPLAVLRPLRDTDPFAAQEPKLRRLTAGGRQIRTFSTAAQNPRISKAFRAIDEAGVQGSSEVAAKFVRLSAGAEWIRATGS